MEEYNDQTAQNLVATFVVAGKYYGLTTARVHEIVKIGEITPVHHSPEFILGIMNLRGRIVTVVDLGCKLANCAQQQSTQSRIFIVEWQQEQVGLLVDSVGEVVDYDANELRSAPENMPPAQAGMLQGVFHAGPLLIGLLNLDLVLDDNFNQKGDGD